MKMTPRFISRPPAWIVLILLLTATLSPACPMCSDALPQSESQAASTEAQDVATSNNAGAGLATGFYYSIVLMLAVPFATMAGLVTMLYRHMRPPQLDSNRPTGRHEPTTHDQMA